MRELELKLIASSILLTVEQGRDKIFRAVEPEYFSEPDLSESFEIIKNAYSANPNADGLIYLSSFGQEEQAFWVMQIESLISPSVAAEQLDSTLQAFIEDYRRRKIKSRVTDLAISEPDAEDVLMLADEVRRFSKPVISTAQKYLDEYNQPVKRISTGFELLDRKLGGGFICGSVATIGARPSTGKTTFAINIATRDPGKKVLFVSLEMSARMIYDRIISDKANVNYDDSIAHLIKFDTVKAVLDEYKNLTVVDDVTNVENIAELIHSLKPDLTVIDFVQIVTTSKAKFDNNRQRIDYISRTLKAAAKQTGAQIIILSQITRAGKDKPTMSDLKESGGLEQDSDYIILLYREYVNDKSNPGLDSKETIVTLDKNKFGSCGEFDMDFNGQKQRFTEATDAVVRPSNEAEYDETDDLPF